LRRRSDHMQRNQFRYQRLLNTSLVTPCFCNRSRNSSTCRSKGADTKGFAKSRIKGFCSLAATVTDGHITQGTIRTDFSPEVLWATSKSFRWIGICYPSLQRSSMSVDWHMRWTLSLLREPAFSQTGFFWNDVNQARLGETTLELAHSDENREPQPSARNMYGAWRRAQRHRIQGKKPHDGAYRSVNRHFDASIESVNASVLEQRKHPLKTIFTMLGEIQQWRMSLLLQNNNAHQMLEWSTDGATCQLWCKAGMGSVALNPFNSPCRCCIARSRAPTSPMGHSMPFAYSWPCLRRSFRGWRHTESWFLCELGGTFPPSPGWRSVQVTKNIPVLLSSAKRDQCKPQLLPGAILSPNAVIQLRPRSE